MVAVGICYFLQFVSYALMLVYQLRLIELILPDDYKNELRLDEKIGESWWPDSWKIPSCFVPVLYLVAPPQKLQAGQHDLTRELKQGGMSWPKVTSCQIPKNMK